MVESRRDRSSAPMLPESRRNAIAELLRMHGAVTVSEVESRFGVSPMTARRDLAALAELGIAQRTHGGAIRPRIAGPELSFRERLDTNAEPKSALAEAAVALLDTCQTVFLDSSSTSYFVAQRIGRGPVQIAPASSLVRVLAHGVRDRELAALKATGVTVQVVKVAARRGL